MMLCKYLHSKYSSPLLGNSKTIKHTWIGKMLFLLHTKTYTDTQTHWNPVGMLDHAAKKNCSYSVAELEISYPGLSGWVQRPKQWESR